MRVGYIRVSTLDQNTMRQLDEMIAFVRDGGTSSCTRWTGSPATSTI